MASIESSTTGPVQQAGRLFPILTAGLTIGVFTLIACVSFGALIFSGELASHLSTGIQLALFGAVMVVGISSLLSSYPGIIAGPHHTTAAVLGLTVNTIIASIASVAEERQILLTAVATIMLNSLVMGIFFFGVGWFKLGELIRFIPYPVIGGFLAGTGWLLLEGSFHFMVKGHIDFAHLDYLFKSETLLTWLPGIGFGILLFIAFRRYHHNLLVLLLLSVVAIAVFYGVLKITGNSLEWSNKAGLLLGSFSGKTVKEPLPLVAITGANWGAIAKQIPKLASLWLIDIIGLLFSVSNIEIAVHRHIHLDRELKVAGIASFVAGLGGGFSGFPLSADTALVYRLTGAKRAVGLIAAAFCTLVLFWGMPALHFCPKFLVGGILVFLGLDLLWDWVYLTWFKLPKADYMIILLILLVIVSFGFLQGIALGIVAAVILFAVNYSQIGVAKRVFSGASSGSHVQRSTSQEKILQEQGEGTCIIELHGLIFFGTAHKLLNQIRKRVNDRSLSPLRFLILDFRLVSGLDTSAVLSFLKLEQLAKEQDFLVLFTDIAKSDERKLRQGGCLSDSETNNRIFPDLDRGLEYCENCILQAHNSVNTQFTSVQEQLQTFLPEGSDSERLRKYLEPRHLEEGEFLFHQGDNPNGLYFLESGQVSVFLELADGKTKRLRTYQSGTILGEIGLYANIPRSASVIADAPSYLYHLSGEAFAKIEREDSHLAASFHKFIVNLLSERLQRRETELRNLLN
jgi:SulP family sulfate permease